MTVVGCFWCGANSTRCQVEDLRPVCSAHEYGVTQFPTYLKEDPTVKTRGLWYYLWKTRKERKARIHRLGAKTPTTHWENAA